MAAGRRVRAAGKGIGMAGGGFDVESWVERLAGALGGLAEVQRDHWEELHGRTAGSAHRDESREPWEGYWRFYHRASEIESRIFERRYGPVRAALTEVKGILSEHPAWAGPLESSDDGQIWVALPNSAGMKSLLPIVAGLMARGREAGEDGFRVACWELHLLLEPGDEEDRDPVREDLLTGYHVVLFQGLMFDEEAPIGNNVSIMPLERLDTFLDAGLLERLEPGAARRQAEEFTAAIVKPFRWQPEFGKDGEDVKSDWSEDESYFEDADVLIELLALYHAAPAVRVASLTPRLHRRACLLLGSLDYHRNFSGRRRSWMSGWLSRPVEARRDAIDAAVAAFADRDGEGFRHCAPVIARLTEALGRRGRFGTDDRILDVAIALERMYRPEDRRISVQLQHSVAEFLGGDEEERSRTKREVKHFYDVRSAIIHGPRDERKKQLLEERPEALRNGSGLARRSVIKVLEEGLPE